MRLKLHVVLLKRWALIRETVSVNINSEKVLALTWPGIETVLYVLLAGVVFATTVEFAYNGTSGGFLKPAVIAEFTL